MIKFLRLKNFRLSQIVSYSLLLISSILVAFPLIYAVMTSFMSTADIMGGKIIPSSLNLSNYKSLLEQIPITNFFVNSLITSVLGTILQIIICSLAAYSIVFINFKSKDKIFLIIMLSVFIPWESIFIPNYFTILNLGLLNSRVAIFLPFIANGLGIFLMVQQFKVLNKSLIEAAKIDGCGHLFIYLRIVLPLSKGILSTWGIYAFLSMWNMYLWPLMISTRPESRTIQIGLKMLKSQETANNFGVLMAAVIMVVIPSLVVLFLGQKQIQKGLTSGAVKE